MAGNLEWKGTNLGQAGREQQFENGGTICQLLFVLLLKGSPPLLHVQTFLLPATDSLNVLAATITLDANPDLTRHCSTPILQFTIGKACIGCVTRLAREDMRLNGTRVPIATLYIV